MNCRVSPSDKPSNIGTQFDNVETYVLAQDAESLVLRGAVGELCISGKLVGRGYLNRPDLTKMRFPYIEEYGKRVYRTGDLVRLLHDGSFEYLGRADDQIKLRGQRLEVDEINSVIKSCVKRIDDVVTLLVRHPSQRKEQLVSFVVRKTKRGSQEGGLFLEIEDDQVVASTQEACKNRLPGYMVPTHIVPINKVPLSANNKADTKQLRAFFEQLLLDDLRGRPRESSAGSLSSQEVAVVNILTETIGGKMSDVTRLTNIFELGLDSITAIGFARSLQRAGFASARPSLIMESACRYSWSFAALLT